jgi:hypothetical protein
MRPPSIVLFEKVFLASIVVGILNTVLSWSLVFKAAENPALRATGIGESLVITSVLIGILLPLLLWYFIARRASTIAKWIYVVLTAFGLLAMVQALTATRIPGSLPLILSALALALQIYAAWLLFKPDAKAWFAGESGDPASRGPIT